jgi:hypothetical protein
VIISASRRTDIPALYSKWFIKRVQAGYCTVPNPFNRQQVARISLLLEDVDVIVFWTRNPKPLFSHLDDLDKLGFHYYFQYTLLGYPSQIDRRSPSRKMAIATFQALARRVGPERVIWRYDPIVFSKLTGVGFHKDNYQHVAEALRGYTHRSVISIMDMYPKFRQRINKLNQDGVGVVGRDGVSSLVYEKLMPFLAKTAQDNGMEIFSCAEERELDAYGILPGKCVDDDYIERTFGIQVGRKKDPGQRKACGCVVSKDIGMYNTCILGCQYCYATSSFDRSQENFQSHDPDSPSLLGWYQPVEELS